MQHKHEEQDQPHSSSLERKRWHTHNPTSTKEYHSKVWNSPCERLLVLNPLMDMESLVLIYNSKNHKLNCGYSIHLMEWKLWKES